MADTFKDLCIPCGDGFVNIRAGAIIEKDGRILMVASDKYEYLYSVGGRLKFGETAEAAAIRETEEETGARLETDSFGFVQECYFTGDTGPALGKPVYEIGYYFYMKVPDDFRPVCSSLTSEGRAEHLEWVSPDDARKVYPTCLWEALKNRGTGRNHYSDDELQLAGKKSFT